MYYKKKTAKAVQLALILSASTAASFSTSALSAEQVESKDVERIEVTGSRLKRTDLETASPVTVVTAETLQARGIQDVGQFLQSNAIMSGSPATTASNNGGTGAVNVSIRGLGSARTLVLINGRRPVSSDFQSIPASMISRIEVLKDGASATYGADAVAGVVNIITRKNFDGIEINLGLEGSFDVDTQDQKSFSVVAGKDFDDGHLVFGVDYVEEAAILQADSHVDHLLYPWAVSPWGETPEEDELSFWQNGLIPPGQAGANVTSIGSGSPICGQYYFAQTPGSANQTNGTCTSDLAQLSDMRDFQNPEDTYNYAPEN